MKILFLGDSVTDAGKWRDMPFDNLANLGLGYVRSIAGNLLADDPRAYSIINAGISGDRIVDLYARIKKDVWNYEPDVLSVLVGVNDVWHEIESQNGVDVERYEKIYRLLIEDTLERFPKLKIILCEPFVLEGSVTAAYWKDFGALKEYQEVVKKLAEEYGLYFVPLQEKLTAAAQKYGVYYYSGDGVHPNTAGAELIARSWLELFCAKIKDAK